MSAATSTTTPAVAMIRPLEDRSRLTKLIARVLQQRCFRSEEMASAVAAEIAEGIIDEHGGQALYVPIADVRPGGDKRESIDATLRATLPADVLRSAGPAPLDQMAEVARIHGVSIRTVWRVLERIRAQGGQ